MPFEKIIVAQLRYFFDLCAHNADVTHVTSAAGTSTVPKLHARKLFALPREWRSLNQEIMPQRFAGALKANVPADSETPFWGKAHSFYLEEHSYL